MARNLPPDRDVAPTVQKLRLHYAKRGRLRFSSHRDFQRALERALRRADIPMAYSAGFSPHPKVSYANAAPTGVASEAEYVEIGVASVCDPAKVRAALDEALPTGFDVVEVVEARTPDFVNRLEASVWRIELPGLTQDEADAAAARFMAEPEVIVERLMKNGHVRRPKCSAPRGEPGGRRPNLCHTHLGRSTRNPVRSTRRRDLRASTRGRPRAAETPSGYPAGTGAT
jgi:radical SAM-linked protein